MTTTITGASGFVGQHLLAHLESLGQEVQPLSMRGPDWQQQLQQQGMGDAVIHLAGKAHDTANTSVAAEYFQVNRDLTIALFDLFLQSDARDFVYFSSVKAVADVVEETLDESHPADPKTPYGQSKFEAEQYLLQQSLPAGKRLFIIRPCMIHGPGNKGNLNLLYSVVSKGIPWPLAAFHNQRSFLSIDNLCFMVGELLARADVPSGIYHFADDEALSTNELIALIGEARGGRKPALWHLPAGMISGLAKIGDLIRLPLNTERLHKLTENYVVSNTKIKNALGIAALPVTAREGLLKTLRSF